MSLRKKTFEHQLVDLAPLDVVEINNRRYYVTPSGAKYPSVTTVIGESSDKRALEKWKAQKGAEADLISAIARTRGTRFHAIAESYLMNQDALPFVATPIEVEAFSWVRDVIDKSVGVVRGIECPLYSDRLQTAGRADVVADFNDVCSVIDFKTARRPKTEKWIEGYFLQAATYALMFEERTSISVPQIAVIISVDNDLPQVFERRVADYTAKINDVFMNQKISI
jgi:genome maintenance exonuclease 1